MPFAKGNKLGKGRPKGSKDVKTEQWNSIGEFLTTKGSERMLVYLNTCEEKEYAETFLKILEYFKPKLARRELTGKDGKDLLPSPIYGNKAV